MFSVAYIPNMKKKTNFLIIPHPTGTIQTPQRFLHTFFVALSSSMNEKNIFSFKL